MARRFADEGAGVIWGLPRLRPATETAVSASAKRLDYL